MGQAQQKFRGLIIILIMSWMILNQAFATRQMENLDRGVVAVRKNSTEVFVSWRLLGLDPAGIEFNVYRSANGGAWTKLNGSPLDAGTNYSDATANLTLPNAYHIRPVVSGVEQAASESWILPANAEQGPLFRIPLQAPYDRLPYNVWPGDADGDGEYEYFVCMQALNAGETQRLDAYKRDGTFLWRVDFGPNSVDSDNIYVKSAAVIAGQMDGITIYDLDSDGRAEAIVKSANGVTFGDGTTLDLGNDDLTQFISVLDGMTGEEKARIELPNPWKFDNNFALGTLFGIGYPDGERPSLMIHAKNRTGGGGTPFNTINSAWDYREGVLSMRWSIQWDGSTGPESSHQMRLVDLDLDGRDELVPGMHAVNWDGTLRWDLHDVGLTHGDRFHVGDLDPQRPGQECYGIQQNNSSGVVEYYMDASTAEILWDVNIGSISDAARGTASDIDPRYKGMEVWSFYGQRSTTGSLILTNDPVRPWPNLQIWWDGDVMGENLDNEVVDKWNWQTASQGRRLTTYHYGANGNPRSVPTFYGDIIGDWREEIIYENYNHDELIVFTTTDATDVRLYTLPHNPAYRNCMTLKGYVQQNLPDYYLGDGMATPPAPDISYVPLQPPADAPTLLTATAANSYQVDLAWQDNADNEYGFKIERSDDGLNFTEIARTGADQTTFPDIGLLADTMYTYRVRAFNGAGDTAYTNEATVTTDQGPPAPPTGLTAVAGNGEVALSWNAVPSATSYHLKRALQSAGPYSVMATVGTANIVDTAVVNGTTYYYVVSALNAMGEGPNSAGVVATPNVIQQGEPPAGPIVIEAEHFDDKSSQGGHDWILVEELAASNHEAMQSLPDDGTAFDTGYAVSSPRLDYRVHFTTAGTYYVWMRGRAAGSDVGSSDSVHAGINETETSSADRIRFASANHAWTNNTMDSVPATIVVPTIGEHSINVWMREDGAMVDKLLLTTDPDYIPSGSGPSESPRGEDPPAAPTGLHATIEGGSIHLDWDDNAEPDLASYNVYRSMSSGSGFALIATGVSPSDYVDVASNPSDSYYYFVTAVNDASTESGPSLELFVPGYNSSHLWVNYAWAGLEDGTELQPFNSLAEALAGIDNWGTIHIEAGASAETPIISKPMRLVAEGGSVRIGQGIVSRRSKSNSSAKYWLLFS